MERFLSTETYHRVDERAGRPTRGTCDVENSWVEPWWRGDVQQ